MADGAVDWFVVDFDGVIRHWDRHHFERTAGSLGLTSAELASVALDDELLGAAMIGDVTADEWLEEIGRRAAERHGCDAVAAARSFSELEWSIDSSVVEVVREVRRSCAVRVALFSNASTNLETDLARCALDAEFDVVANSSRIRLVKPDPAAFVHVAGLLEADPRACLFVDDLPANVAGARRAGMRAEVFRSAEELRDLLVREGVLRSLSRP